MMMEYKNVWIVVLLTLYIGNVASDVDIGYFWHVTDFHYDDTYYGRQLSCNENHKPTDPGKYGDFWCDSPWDLVTSAVDAMNRLKPDADFALWTGDTVLHTGDENLNYTINAEILTNVTDALKTLPFPVYSSFGNHDYYPNNQFPPTNNALYNDTWDRWGHWVNDATQGDNFRKGGYYTVKTSHGLRIIALNTNLYYTSNKATIGSDDPGDQLQWLNHTLAMAKSSNEQVLITAHIPPGPHTPDGVFWMYTAYNGKLVNIMRRFAGNIVGMHFGHDHADGFKILPDLNDNPATPMFIAPSVTPWRYVIPTNVGPAHNPGIRLIKYDRSSGRHLDLEQYYLDLVTANQDDADDWKLEYRTSDVYHVPDLSASSLTDLVSKMDNQDSDVFKKYWIHTTVSVQEHLQSTCDDQCHSAIMCGFDNFYEGLFEDCKTDRVSGSKAVAYNLAILVLALVVFKVL